MRGARWCAVELRRARLRAPAGFAASVARGRLRSLHRARAQGGAWRALAEGQSRGAAAALRRRAAAEAGLSGAAGSCQRRPAHRRQSRRRCSWCDGVMLGREAYHRPYLLAELHAAAVRRWLDGPRAGELLVPHGSLRRARARGRRAPRRITRHMLGLYSGRARGAAFRQYLSRAHARWAGRARAAWRCGGCCVRRRRSVPPNATSAGV